MKPFNLEEAKAGKPVVTRDGRSAKVIYWDGKDYPIIALIGEDEDILRFTKDGRFFYTSVENSLDLVMAPEKKEGWINIYKCNINKRKGKNIYTTKEQAIKGASDDEYITTIKIEWEE